MSSSPTPKTWYQWITQDRTNGDATVELALHSALIEMREVLIEQADLSEARSVLDLGCGDGFVGLQILLEYPQIHVTFVDHSSELIATVRRACYRLGFESRSDFHTLDLEDLQPATKFSVDRVVSRAVLMHMSDKAGALTQWRKFLNPGGRLVSVDPFTIKPPTKSFRGISMRGLEEQWQKIQAHRQSHNGELKPNKNFSPNTLLEAAAAADFEYIEFNSHCTKLNLSPCDWDTFLDAKPDPFLPSLRHSTDQALNQEERSQFLNELQTRLLQPVTRHFAFGVLLCWDSHQDGDVD